MPRTTQHDISWLPLNPVPLIAPPIQAILPTKGRPEYAAVVLQSLMYQTHPLALITIIDQGDTSAMASPLFRKMVTACGKYAYPVAYHHVKGVESITKVRALEKEFAVHPWVYLVDDDVMFPPSALSAAVEAKQATGAGLVANIEFDIDYENIRMPDDGGPGQLWLNRADYARKHEPYFEMMWPQASNLLLDKECYPDMDIVDYDHAEDLFFCYQMKKQYGAYTVSSPRVHHFAAGTRTNERLEQISHWDMVRFIEKAGFKELLAYRSFQHPCFWLQGVSNAAVRHPHAR